MPPPPPPAAARAPHFRLLSLSVTGGYFDGLALPFAPHVSCLIGGKGAGKTTAFELTRFGFALPYHPSVHDPRALVKKNLGGGLVRIDFETEHGVRAYLERSWRDDRPRYFTEDGQPLTMAPGACPIDLYGQDEIESVGGDRASQLLLLDRLGGEELRALSTEIADVLGRLQEGAQAILTLEAEITALESDASEARAIDEQLKPLLAASGNDGALLVNAHAAKGVRTREAHAMKNVAAALADVRTQTDTLAASARRKLGAEMPPETREGPNADIFAAVRKELVAVSGALETFAVTVLRQADVASASIASLTGQLAALHAKADEAYDALLARQKEDHARTSERARLQERHAVVSRAVPLLDERVRRHAELRRAQDALAERLDALLDARGAVRLRVKNDINAEFEAQGVKVEVHLRKNDAAYRAYLRDVFRAMTNDQPKWLVDKVSRLTPNELVALVRASDAAGLTERAEMKRTPERAAQVIAALTPSAHLLALQAMPIDDEGILFVKHGVAWKDTVECSPGQRCGGILPLVLLCPGSVLAVDQPDDNIDPEFLCGVILRKVASLAGRRQFLFVTHAANVPVLSAAQEILFIESDGRSARLEANGDVEKMKAWVLAKLEGGPEAFDARRALYERDPDEK